jgi:hypothetical protein
MAWQAVPSRGYFLKLTENQNWPYKHLFCGEHTIPGAWCVNCNRPLLRFLTLDLSDPVLELGLAGELLTLLYCWTCRLAQTRFYYRCLPGDAIEVVSAGRGGHTPDFPYNAYPTFFPGKFVRPVALTVAMQDRIVSENAGKAPCSGPNGGGIPSLTETVRRDLPREKGRDRLEPRHQIGGQPFLLDTYRPVTCPICRCRMPFVVCISDESGAGIGFTGNPYVQVLYHLCRSCRCVGAYHQTD